MRDIILTGIPRAGTTLAASLLDAEKNTVCLNEPEWQHPHPVLDAAGFAQAVKEDFADVRKKFLRGEAVPDRRANDGSAVTNYYDGGMKNTFVMHPLVRNNLPADFTLAIKHNGPYLAVLPELIALGCFDIRAVIRHPLPILRSWQRLDVPVSRGEMPNAIAYWPEMKVLTASNIPLLEKQALMLELMFARIAKYQAELTLIRYEEIADDENQLSGKPTKDDTKILATLEQFAPSARGFYKL